MANLICIKFQFNRLLILALLILSALFSNSIIAQNIEFNESKLEELDEYFQRNLEEWKVPGMSIAILENDEVVFAKGYGVRNIESKDKVDENTVFGIASLTKAFTSAALAILVDEGKISWDDKVTQYLPYFELYDPYVTENMKIRDLLCHRSGLKTFSGDLLWNSTSYSRKEVIKRAKYLKPVYGFREHFGYSNIMFLAAGEIIPAVTDTSFDDFLKYRFFNPLGMKVTSTSISAFKDLENLATPHVQNNNEILPIEYISWDNIAPAGGINSNVIELCNWMRLQLHKGTLDSVVYFSEEASKMMWKPHTMLDIQRIDEKFFPSVHFRAYGLGWAMFDYHGRKIVTHSGGLDGMISRLVLIPEENVGFVILSNSIESLPYPLMYKIMDVLFEKPGRNYCNTFLRLINSNREYQLEQDKLIMNSRDSLSMPSLELSKYTGTYGGDLYGNAEVRIKNGQLEVQFLPAPNFVSVLEHWEHDTFSIEFTKFPSLPPGKANFVFNNNKEVIEMKIDVPNPDFDFKELIFLKLN